MGKRKSLLHSLLPAFLFGLVSSLPVLAWMLRNLLLAGSATNRYINTIPIPASDYTLLKETLHKWFFPYQVALSIGPGKLALILPAVALLLVGIWLARRQKSPVQSGDQPVPSSILPWFFVLFGLIYPVFILVSRLYFDSLITFWEERIVYPLYLTGLILAVFAAWWLLNRLTRRANWAGILVGVALLSVYVSVAGTFLQLYREPRFRVMDDCRVLGRGYNSPAYYSSPILQKVKTLDPRSLIYADNLEQLYFLSGLNSFQLNNWDASTISQVKEYESQRPLAFILFTPPPDLPQTILSSLPNARIVYSDVDGVIITTK